MQDLLSKIDQFAKDETKFDILKQGARDIVQLCGDKLCAKNISFDKENFQITFDWSEKDRIPLDWMKEYHYHEYCKLTLNYFLISWDIAFDAPGVRGYMSCETFLGIKQLVNDDLEYIKAFLGLAPPFWIGKYNKFSS